MTEIRDVDTRRDVAIAKRRVAIFTVVTVLAELWVAWSILALRVPAGFPDSARQMRSMGTDLVAWALVAMAAVTAFVGFHFIRRLGRKPDE